MTSPPRQFTVTLRAQRDVVDPVAELRALLKVALRRHGFRCLLCAPEAHRDRPEDGAQPEESGPTP